MLRSLRILLFSSIALLPAVATGATSETDTQAAEACDKGAAVPLDPEAKAPPVQFTEIIPYDFDMTKLQALQRGCQQAWAGAPKDKRLQLQWLRVSVALGKQDQQWLLVPQVRMLADAGSAEAQYLMFRMFNPHPGKDDSTPLLITKDEALADLRKSAEQGHLTALLELMSQYRGGQLLRRDNHEAVRVARRIESAPPQGNVETDYEAEMRGSMALSIALITLDDDSFSKAEQRIAFGTLEKASGAGTSPNYAALAYFKALRFGRGTEKDAVKARQLLETRVATDQSAVPMLADMLAKGEGGPVDGKRALALLRDKDVANVDGAAAVLAGLLLDGKFVGAQPQAAIRVLSRSWHLADQIRLAGLLVDYHSRLEFPDRLVEPLAGAANAGDPQAALALAKLKLSDNSQFTDVAAARALLKPFADAGDRQSLWLYASSQYANLAGSSFKPYRQADGMSDEDLRRLIEEGMAKKEPEAFLLRARLTRKGVVYPQDDQAATNLLISAANLGNVEAMVLLGNAYDEGLGTPKNPRERLRAWREAARHGSLAARQNLANAFVFDSFGKLMTLDEGVTMPLVLYINSVDRAGGGLSIDDTMAEVRLGTMFSFGSRALEAGVPAVAEAAMNAFREAPAGLDDKTLVTLGKAFPDDIRVAIERKLKSEGFYSGDPNGYFGPDVRKALAAWVDAEGPMGAETASDQKNKPAAAKIDLVPPEIVDRVRASVLKESNAARTPRQKLSAISGINALAQYGDIASRWALVSNYHQVAVVRKVVSAAELTRYALDVLVTKPEGAEKADFDFIFDVTQIQQDGQIRVFGSAVLAAIRDDARLQDPLTLGGIMQQFVFAPGACDAMLDAAKKARIKDLGQDGCDDTTMTALIGFAKARGPAGVDASARKAAALEVKSMDEEAAK